MRMISIIGASAVIVAATAALALGQSLPLQNGSFQDGLTGWESRGTAIVATNPQGNSALMLREENSGGLSRVYQEFAVPAVEPGEELWLGFTYGFYSSSPSRAGANEATPPHSFLVMIRTHV
jgi:hypothetical protein